MTLTPAAAAILVNTAQTYTAAAANLNSGERVTTYAWTSKPAAQHGPHRHRDGNPNRDDAIALINGTIVDVLRLAAT